LLTIIQERLDEMTRVSSNLTKVPCLILIMIFFSFKKNLLLIIHVYLSYIIIIIQAVYERFIWFLFQPLLKYTTLQERIHIPSMDGIPRTHNMWTMWDFSL